MVRLEKHGDSAVRFIFTDSDHYLYKDGVVDVPVNSLSLVIDESEMVTFKKASTADPFISFRLDKSNFSSRDELLTFYKENMVGTGGISEEEVQEMIDAATSGIPSSEVVEQLRRDVNAVSGEVDTKQDILTAGENITISGNVISADAGNNIIELTQAEYDALETKDPEALYIITDAQEINMNDYYTKSEVDAEIASIDLSSKADASALTAVQDSLTAHTANTEVHVTSAEKDTWNAKADASALTAVQDSLSGYVTTTTYESGQYATAQALNALQENKLDASAYTPTDLSEYWTSRQTQNAINAATSGIPSSQVIEQLQTDVNNLQGETNGIWDTIDEKEEVIASALTQLNQDVSAIDAKEEVIASALTEVRQRVDKKSDIVYVDFWGMFNDSFEMDDAKWNEMVEAYDDNAIFYAIPNGDYNNTASPLTVEYNAQGRLWFNLPWGNGYTSFYLNRIEGRDGYEYHVSDVNEYIIIVDDQLDSASTNPVQNAVITQALENKLDASAYTPTDLSQYWTSAQTQNAINAATSGIPSSQVIEQLRTDLNTLSGAVIDNEYTVSQAINSLNDRVTAVEEGGGTDLSQYWTSAQTQSAIDNVNNAHTANTTVHVTSAEKTAWNAKQDALTAGSGITISNNVISTTGVVMSQQVTQIVKLTQAQYSALSTKDNQTLYIVVD